MADPLKNPGVIVFPHRQLSLNKIGQSGNIPKDSPEFLELNKIPDPEADTPADFKAMLDEKEFRALGFYRKALGFSGCDISATIKLPQYVDSKGQVINDNFVFHIGTLQTLSISTYESKTPLKAIGFKNAIAVARGSRTIAGTLIFNQLHTHVFNDSPEYVDSLISGDKFIADAKGFITYASGNAKLFTDTEKPEDRKKYRRLNWDFSWDKGAFGDNIKASELPPFDIIINFLNEKGNTAKIILYGVELVHESQTLSVEDIYTEVQYQYIARDIEHFNNVYERSKNVNAYLSPGNAYEPFDVYRAFAEPIIVEEEAQTPAQATATESAASAPAGSTATPAAGAAAATAQTEQPAGQATIVAPDLPPTMSAVIFNEKSLPPNVPLGIKEGTKGPLRIRTLPVLEGAQVTGKKIQKNGTSFSAISYITNGAEYTGPDGQKSTIWVKVDMGNGENGYVAGTFTDLIFPPPPSSP
jgi:hypothetical protein